MHNSYSLQDIFNLLDNHKDWIMRLEKDGVTKDIRILKSYKYLKPQQGLILLIEDSTDTSPWVYFPIHDGGSVRFTFSIVGDGIVLQKEAENVTRVVLTPFKRLDVKTTNPRYYVSTD